MSSTKNNPIDNNDPWSSSSDDDDNDDDENEDQGDRFTFYSICSYRRPSAQSFDTLALALEHDVTNYGFDFFSHLPLSTVEDGFFEEAIILVNKCRQFVKDWDGGNNAAAGKDDAEAQKMLGMELNEYLKSHTVSGDLDEEENMKYFKPVLEDDAILMCVDELCELKSMKDSESNNGNDALAKSSGDGSKEPNTENESAMVKELQSKVALLEEQLARAKACISSLAMDDDESISDGSCSDEENKKSNNQSPKSKKSKSKKAQPDNDTYYFSSYSNTSIHETMLRDTVRTAAYESAILSNSESLFRDKIVLDIGCGTGVLSMFCAKAGAKKVIAVDNSDIIIQAREHVELNGFKDVIECVRGKMETLIETNALPLLKGETVDIIVSEWMGYALFFETMLPSVMVARDAIMTPVTGTMYPNVAKIFLEGGNDKERVSYWDNVHGLNMSPMKERMIMELTQDASVEVVDDSCIVTDRAEAIAFDLNTCKDEGLDFEAPFELRLRDKDSASSSDDLMEIHQLVVSFDIDFHVPNTTKVSFSTGCQSTPTHWKQSVLWFDTMHNCPVLDKRKGDIMRGTFRMKRNAENHRAIDMAVIWETGRLQAENGGSWERTMDGVLKRSLIA